MLWGDPILTHSGHNKRHSRKARLFKLAYQQYLDSLCKDCGHSGILTYDPLNTPHFTPESVVCVACEHREAEARADKENGDEPWPGTKTFVTNHIDDDRTVT